MNRERKNYTEDLRPALQPTCWENNHRPSQTLSFRGHANKFEEDLGHHPPIVAKELHWHFSSIWRNAEGGLWRHESVEDEFLQHHTTCHALENPNCMGLVYHEALVVHSSGDVCSRMKGNSYWVERAWGESTLRAQVNSSMHSRELLGQDSWCPFLNEEQGTEEERSSQCNAWVL